MVPWINALGVPDGSDPIRITNTPFNEWPASFSPDGRWVAYDSPESGRREIYVVSFPGLEGRWQVSAEGRKKSRWTSLFWQAEEEIGGFTHCRS